MCLRTRKRLEICPPVSGILEERNKNASFVEIKRNISNQYLMDYLKVYFKELVDGKYGDL